MNRKIKLIWDFFGEDAADTAMHHAKHLKEFADREKISTFEVDAIDLKNHAEAYMIIKEENMLKVRDRLRPQRGQWVEKTSKP